MSDSQQQGVPAVGFLVVAFLDEWAADQALDAGGRVLPAPVRWLMRGAAKVMTTTAHRL